MDDADEVRVEAAEGASPSTSRRAATVRRHWPSSARAIAQTTMIQRKYDRLQNPSYAQ